MVLNFFFLGQPHKPEDPIVEHVDADFVPERKRLYQIQIGMGFLELPQIELTHGVLKQVIVACIFSISEVLMNDFQDFDMQ